LTAKVAKKGAKDAKESVNHEGTRRKVKGFTHSGHRKAKALTAKIAKAALGREARPLFLGCAATEDREGTIF
jgi:hypothetical protein